MKYIIVLFGNKLKENWNPFKIGLYEFILPHLIYHREWYELEAIYDEKTKCFHVTLRSGKGA